MKIDSIVGDLSFPNFLKCSIGVSPVKELQAEERFDVGSLFATDEDAGKYWDEQRSNWVAHVAKRRVKPTSNLR